MPLFEGEPSSPESARSPGMENAPGALDLETRDREFESHTGYLYQFLN
jgi:hypothetical protein